jgi:hypothetical protein
MKRLFMVFLFLAIQWVCSPYAFVHAQAASQPAPGTPVAPVTTPPEPADQWVSHQMNQPPPETGDKYALSPGLVEEIKQLYLQAKKEHEAKAAGKTQGEKDQGVKGDNAGKGKR